MDTKAASPIQSLDRIFSIIEFLSQYPNGASLTEICLSTHLPKSTVSRMLDSLIFHSYAIQDATSKRYLLTLRLFEIGSRVADNNNLLAVARPYLETLSSVSDETIHLVIREKDEVIYLYKKSSLNHTVQISSFVGSRNPLYCTGVGKCILAYLSDEELFSIWGRINPIPFTPNTITSFSALQREIERIRTCGSALDNAEHELGVCCIAAPVLDFHSNPLAAISICAPTIRMGNEKIHQYAPILIEVARKISRCFGA